MNILIVIQTAGQHNLAVAEANITYCIHNYHRVFVIEIAADENSSALQNRNEPDYLRLPYNPDQGMLFLQKDFLKITGFLHRHGFAPDVIEFYDEFALAYLFTQHVLTGFTFASTTKIMLNLTGEQLHSPFTLAEGNTLPAYFQRTALHFLLRASDAVFCHHPTLRATLAKDYENLAVKLEATSFQDDSSNLFFQKKYAALQPGTKVNGTTTLQSKKNYPFTGGKEQSIQISNETPLLSVIIPYFNMHDYITETIASVLNSTYKHIEIIIVNDGSTAPSTAEILNRLQTQSKTIRVIHQQNGGVARARNNGIAAAEGEIIALLDADDLVTPSYYEKAVNLLKRFDNIGFVGCWTEFFNDQRTIDHWITHNPEPPLFFLLNTINTQALVIKKTALVNYGLHDPNLKMVLDDWESAINMLVHGIRGIVIPEFLFRYRIRPNSVFRSNTDQWIKSYQKIIDKHFQNLTDYTKDLLILLTVNGPNIFYKAPEQLTDYYHIMNTLPNYRIRHSLLTKMINRYYNFVELNPLGIKIRTALKRKHASSEKPLAT
jgi:glycosyltransferase involved in cell wall biosynthesis